MAGLHVVFACVANGSWLTVPRDGSGVQLWTYLYQACIARSLLACGRYTADMQQSWSWLSYVVNLIFGTIKMSFFLHFSVSFLREITDSPVSCNLYFPREVLPCVVERRLTQSARSLVFCWRSSRTGRPAALFGCDKNRCRLPQFIDLPQLHVALFFKWPAVHSFSTVLYLHDYRLCNNSTLHTRSGFSVLYWVILQRCE